MVQKNGLTLHEEVNPLAYLPSLFTEAIKTYVKLFMYSMDFFPNVFQWHLSQK